ncbi:MAG TPA: hypothetical protein VK558_14275 [Patescibacteria group bacterium]|nr:hypothetical protein [Patescibacteria group bacterium]
MRVSREVIGVLAVLGLALAGHLEFWQQNAALRAETEIIPVPPSPRAVSAMAFGDRQGLYRVLGHELQDFGDTGGRVTPLLNYDYDRVLTWLRVLDGLDERSDYTMSLAGYLFGQISDPRRAGMMADYIRQRALQDPVRNWRWMAYAVFVARHRAKDMPMALSIARDLAAIRDPSLPVWTRQMPAFVLASVGDNEAASDLMGAILGSATDISPEERNFMNAFIAAHK